MTRRGRGRRRHHAPRFDRLGPDRQVSACGTS